MKRVSLLLGAALVMLAMAALPTHRASAQSTTITDDNLEQSIANAKTAADYEALAAYYDAAAADAKKKAAIHKHSASNLKPVGMANMCNTLAKEWNKVATQDKQLAAAYSDMAKAAAKAGQ